MKIYRKFVLSNENYLKVRQHIFDNLDKTARCHNGHSRTNSKFKFCPICGSEFVVYGEDDDLEALVTEEIDKLFYFDGSEERKCDVNLYLKIGEYDHFSYIDFEELNTNAISNINTSLKYIYDMVVGLSRPDNINFRFLVCDYDYLENLRFEMEDDDEDEWLD